jgi:hypothetical protein
MADGLERVAPNRGWGALARGAYHILRKEPNQAASWLAKAEVDPDVETLLTVAAGWLMIRNPSAAERVFKRVLEMDPATPAPKSASPSLRWPGATSSPPKPPSNERWRTTRRAQRLTRPWPRSIWKPAAKPKPSA